LAVVHRLLFVEAMSVGSFRQSEDTDQGSGREFLGGGGAPGKRAPTDAIQRKADGTQPAPLTSTPHATPGHDAPAPTMGQSYVDSIVHGSVDPKKVAEEQIAHGLHDENKITNEVFWACKPDLRNKHLVAGSDDAKEWLRIRDEIVRPALSGHNDPKVGHGGAKEVEGHDLAEVHGVVTRADAKLSSGDPKIDALLADAPPNGAPNKDEAAWLLRAIAAGFVGAPGQTKPQLEQLARGETALRTRERDPRSDLLKRGIDALEKQDIHAQKIKSGEYEVDGGHLPILGAMVDITAGRIREWVKGGGKGRKQLFWFGDMVRADAGFAEWDDKKQKGKLSSHSSGNAIDLGINYSSDADIVAVLSGLEPGKIQMVFPDGGAENVVEHVHLAVTDDGKYELGVSFSAPFFPHANHLLSAKAAAEKAAMDKAGGAKPEEGTTIAATGAYMWNPYWFECKATFTGGKWKWKDEAKGLARHHIKSSALRSLLDKLEKGTPPKVSKVAVKEDGGKARTGDEHE
jgi:hypothetical protein